MKLDKLPKIKTTGKKRVGRGYGSGRGGHTVGRGQKGQGARNKTALWFEGGQLPSIRRFPYVRGKRRFNTLEKDTIIINLKDLNRFEEGEVITLKSLVDSGLVGAQELEKNSVKVLGHGKLTKALTITLDTSAKAQEKIQKAGGKVDRGQAE